MKHKRPNKCPIKLGNEIKCSLMDPNLTYKTENESICSSRARNSTKKDMTFSSSASCSNSFGMNGLTDRKTSCPSTIICGAYL